MFPEAAAGEQYAWLCPRLGNRDAGTATVEQDHRRLVPVTSACPRSPPPAFTQGVDTSTNLEATAFEAIDPDLVAGFAALADPTRLAILRTLLGGAPRCVCDVNAAVPVAANVLSYHLKILREAGLVTATRRGRWVDYELVPAMLERLRTAVPRALDPVGAKVR